MYKPRYVGVLSSACASVTLDCRLKRMRQGLKSRLQCRNCPGSTTNVGTCAHVEFMLNQILCDTEACTEGDMNAIGMHADDEIAVLSDVEDEEDRSSLHSGTDSPYCSYIKCNIFARETEAQLFK